MGRHSSRPERRPLDGLVLHQCVLVERYDILRDIGDGSFGTVSLARRKSTGPGGQLVAVKSMKKPIEPPNDCLKLREVQSLYALPQHPAIVLVFESFYDPKTQLFHMVMEQMDQNLYQLIRSRQSQKFDLITVKNILSQVLEALEHCHAHNYFHRDIKPENVLVSSVQTQRQRQEQSILTSSTSSQDAGQFLTPPSTPAQYLVKLADFGLAREITSRPPYTSYVSTRWYRAPEVLLRAEHYSAPVDMWAFGAMAVELATLSPLFPGKNEVDQVWRICEVMGSPADWRTRSQVQVGGGPWKDAAPLADKLGFSFPKVAPVPMVEILGSAWPESMARFTTQLLRWDPSTRPTSSEALLHDFFDSPTQDAGISAAMISPSKTKTPFDRSESDVNTLQVQPRKGFFKNVQGGLQRQPSCDSVRLPAPQLRLPHTAKSQPGSNDQSGYPGSTIPSTHRQSWFARRRDNAGGHRSTLDGLYDTDGHNAQILSNKTEQSGPEAMAKRTLAPVTLLPPVLPLSPMRDITPIGAQDSSSNRFFHDESHHHPGQAQETPSTTVQDFRTYSKVAGPGSNIPVRVPISTKSRKNSRSVSEYSLEQRSPSLRKTYEQGVPSERQSGIGGLFSHLRKKTKRSEQSPSPNPPQAFNLPAGKLENSANALSRQPKDRRLAGDNRLQPQDQAQKVLQDTLDRPIGLNDTSQLSQSLPANRSPLMQRSLSLAASKRRQTGPHRDGEETRPLPTPRSSGPISSRTRKAVNQAQKLGVNLYAYDVPDEEEEMLEAELRSAAHAMKHLTALPDSPASNMVTRPVPSYAKSTAASTRRSSNFNTCGGSLGRQASRRVSGNRLIYLQSPRSEGRISPVAEVHA